MDDYEKYLNMTLRFLSYRGRSEKEVRDYLAKKKAPEEFVEKIIESCREYGFINDEKFAEDWTVSRARNRLKSKRVIRMELKQKGIAEETIDEVLQSGSGKNINDLEQAKLLAHKRMSRYRNLPREEIYRKLGGYLGRRGYNWDVIKAAIDEVLGKSYNTD